ncbi:TetR/AcrR family transcriptional regulator [Bradyrhizobium sp.]|uniref:TetR/AcrR family transcriptional regulator n=1 Tax=Bradyrhizobium sp. TaxID=376 RepID=UPI003BB0BA1F
MEAAVRTKREDLVQAAKKLMCQRGYEAVSPRDLLDESGAGQGSFYHHFRSKHDLAIAALEEVSSEMQALAHKILDAGPSPLEGINTYLGLPRDGLKGCRMGRFANEASIVDTSLRAPIENYFRDLQATLAKALRAAQAAGELASHLDVEELALMLMTVIQGGFVLSRIYRDRSAVRRATDMAAKILGMLP